MNESQAWRRGFAAGFCGTCAVGRGSSGDRGAGVRVLLAVAGHAGGIGSPRDSRRSSRRAALRNASPERCSARCCTPAHRLRSRGPRGFRLYRRPHGEFLVQLRGVARHPRQPKPEWLKVRMPGGGRYEHVKRTLRELNLHTVCEEASCPNVGECWGGGTATVMLMGDVCTRGCRFCDVSSGTPGPLDPLEPRHLAEAAGRLGPGLPGGDQRESRRAAGRRRPSHFAQADRGVATRGRADAGRGAHARFPRGRTKRLQMIVDARPTVAAHNLETVERLTPRVRDRRAAYRQSLDVLDFYKRGGMRTKSSIMLGLGERHDEVVQALARPAGGGLRHPHARPVSASEREAPGGRGVSCAPKCSRGSSARGWRSIPLRRGRAAGALQLQGGRVLHPAVGREGLLSRPATARRRW